MQKEKESNTKKKSVEVFHNLPYRVRLVTVTALYKRINSFCKTLDRVMKQLPKNEARWYGDVIHKEVNILLRNFKIAYSLGDNDKKVKYLDDCVNHAEMVALHTKFIGDLHLINISNCAYLCNELGDMILQLNNFKTKIEEKLKNENNGNKTN